MISINKLSPTIRLPFKDVRGNVQHRQEMACDIVGKFYRDIIPKFKNERLTFFQVEQSIKNILGNKVKLSVRQNPNSSIFDGGSDILYSDFTGQISKTTIDIDTVKNKINRERLGTLLHEFQHVADQLFHPKYLTRNQKMANIGLYTKKYDRLYDEVIYNREFPEGRKDKKYILKRMSHKIKNFLREFGIEDKVDYLQDIRYALISEKYAYSTQRKYAKIMNKKHFLINKKDLENENKIFMFDEKIKLLKNLTFEIIQKERLKHAQLLKKRETLQNINKKV